MSTLACRLCLLNDDLMSLLTRRMRSRDILGKIQKYLQLEITNSDGRSTDICMKCLSKIEDFHIFWTIVQNNQQLLMATQIIPSTNPIILSECEEELNITFSSKHDDSNHETSITQTTEMAVLTDVESSDIENEVSLDAVHEFVGTELNEPISIDIFVKNQTRDDMDSHQSINQSISNMDNESECRMENEGKLDPLDVMATNRKWQMNDFPKIILKGTKLVVRGRELIYIMSRFFDLKCNLCPPDSSEFICVTELFTHYNDAHSIKGYVVCCSQKFSRRDKMAFHMARHLQPEAFTCSVCKKVMKTPTILRDHQQTHLSESDRQWACPSCPRRFCYQTSLSEHLISHIPETKRVAHTCTDCGKSYKSNARLWAHQYYTHRNPANQFVCTICGKQFTQRGNLDSHLITHESHAHQVQCEQCGKWLKSKSVLSSHIKFTHSDIVLKCKLCDYSVRRKQLFNNHMRIKHSDSKPYKCEYCNKSFKLKSLLNTHIVQHTGEVKFTCEFCGRKFVCASNYYTHRRTMHKIEFAEQRAKKEEEEQKLRDQSIASRT